MKINTKELVKDFSRYIQLGTPEQIEELITRYESVKSKLEEYQLLGDVSDVKSLIRSYRSLSNNESSSELDEYHKLGTIDQVKELINRYSEIKLNESVSELSQKYGMSPEIIRNMINKVESVDKVEDLLVDILGNLPKNSMDRTESATIVPQVSRSEKSSETNHLRKLLNKNL